ncbi:phenylacetate-CoA oxygenase subunit PaaI [Alicyclobacillaceae bacterium I2511]|nr:phenylacetate-CoA oxygenase subunit PaaI [Alicyclobacillaceae bacterium I2511]
MVEYLLQMADDELVLGQRYAEWLGIAPDLEEDVAFSSISQDELAHSLFYYSLLEKLGVGGADALAYARPVGERRNSILLERPRRDWAYTLVRGLCFDVWEQIRLVAAMHSTYLPLAQGAQKIHREERYHLLHMQTWFERLGTAGGEARERLEQAVAQVWVDLPDLFSLGTVGDALQASGILSLTAAKQRFTWEERMQTYFTQAGMVWRTFPATPAQNGRMGQHSADLTELLNTFTEVYQTNPAAVW